VYQILHGGDEWNILKCTLHLRRVQPKGPNLRSINVSGANMLGANLRG
jgi:uncharacterized protein YjbI with pentapeptide repeats